MTVREQTCRTIICDDCGEDLRPGDEYCAHFDSSHEARRDAQEYYDWTFDGDRDLCNTCTARVVCDRDGHDPDVYDNSPHEWCKRCGEVLREVTTPVVTGGVL